MDASSKALGRTDSGEVRSSWKRWPKCEDEAGRTEPVVVRYLMGSVRWRQGVEGDGRLIELWNVRLNEVGRN